MFVAILLPVAGLVWALSRPEPSDGTYYVFHDTSVSQTADTPTLDVQNHAEERPMTEAEFVRRWGRITGG